jgi:hypothetical protein
MLTVSQIQVVEPIERMVKLLSMLMKDPLGYQDSPQYKQLKQEEDEAADESLWGKEVLKGAHHYFMSYIQLFFHLT